MKILPSANANEAVLVANTPSFIFKRLREDSVVRYIADTHSADDIASWFAHHSDVPKTAEELVLRYMYLVAISMKNATDIFRLIGQIPVDSFQWGKEISELAIARARPMTVIPIETNKPKPKSITSTGSTGIFVPDGNGFQLRWTK